MTGAQGSQEASPGVLTRVPVCPPTRLSCFPVGPPLSQHQDLSASRRTALICLFPFFWGGGGGHLLSWWGSSGLVTLARLCQCLHRAMLRCQAPCLRPAPTEEAPCPGWATASHPADLASFQSPHPLKVRTRGPSRLRQDRLRGGRGKRDNASKITPLKAVHPPPFLHSSPGRQRPS